jgi:hypothetical protein
VTNLELWKTVPDGAREMLPGGRCPRCSGIRTHRSRTRSILESLLRMFTPLRAFTCSTCQWRGWRVPVASQGPLLELPPLPPPKKKRRVARTSIGKRIYSPSEFARKQARRHVLLAILLALAAGATLGLCREEEVEGDAASLPVY